MGRVLHSLLEHSSPHTPLPPPPPRELWQGKDSFPLREEKGRESQEAQVLGNLPSCSPGLGKEGGKSLGEGRSMQGINYCKGKAGNPTCPVLGVL